MNLIDSQLLVTDQRFHTLVFETGPSIQEWMAVFHKFYLVHS